MCTLLPGKNAFRAIPAIAAIAGEVKVIEVSQIVKVRPSLNPRPHTKITAAIIRLRDFDKSTWFSTIFLTPIADIIPYRMKEIPQIFAVGIVEIIAENLGMNDKRMVQLIISGWSKLDHKQKGR